MQGNLPLKLNDVHLQEIEFQTKCKGAHIRFGKESLHFNEDIQREFF